MQSSKFIQTHTDAYSVLGIPEGSSETDIKRAYKNLVKLFHPDVTGGTDDEIYTRVVEAYEFLCANPSAPPAQASQTPPSSGKILGSPSQIYRTGSNREDFERKYQEQKARKAKEWDRQMEEYAADQKRREEEYRRTMEAIQSIRIAEAIKAMIKDKE